MSGHALKNIKCLFLKQFFTSRAPKNYLSHNFRLCPNRDRKLSNSQVPAIKYETIKESESRVQVAVCHQQRSLV